MSGWPRVIVHADLDAFFAAVELLDFPELKGKPVIIGGLGPRSVVSTANYEARRFGVGSAMPMAVARRRIPHAIIRPPRFERYQAKSQEVMAVFARYASVIEPLSLDEAFLDLSDTYTRFPSPEALGAALKADVRAATGLTVSVGIAHTKYAAKVASDLDKPDGLRVLPPDQAVAVLATLPTKRLWGAGPKTVERLAALGLTTIGQVAAAEPAFMETHLGRLGLHLWHLAHNDDPRPVEPPGEAKSIGAERTLIEDVVGADALTPYLVAAANEVARRLAKRGKKASGVRVKLKTASFQIHTRQAHITPPQSSAAELLAVALRLLPAFDLSEPMRLVGIGTFDFDEPSLRQLYLPGLAPTDE